MTTTKERTRKISSKRKRNNSDSESSPSPKLQTNLKKEKKEKKENPSSQDSTLRLNKPWQNNGTYVDMDVQSNSLLIVFDFTKIGTLMSTEDREKYLPFLKNSETSSV
jgi:hypothetical protein